MPYDYTCTDSYLIIIRHWGPLTVDQPLSKRPCESHGPFHITALVYGRGENGLISNKLAEKLRSADHKQATKVPPVVWISWTFDGLDQNLETSQVHIAPGLEQDLILGDNTNEIYRSVHISPPEEQLPLQPDTREYFQKHGISAANKRSENMLKDLMSLFRPKAQPDNVKTDVAGSEPEEIERPSEVSSESSPSPTFYSISNTGSDADNWITDFSNSIHNVSFPQAPYLDTNDQTFGAYCNVAAHLDRTHFKPGPKNCAEGCGGKSSLGSASYISEAYSPISNWSFVCKESGEMEDREVIQQCQQNEFETHPGHHFWIWDRQRQLWRLRGRDGLDEEDRFTELFFQ
ncbi:hypothetical protein NXS19_005129 [Fusarium pseudograminearum]|uniref:Uncharacterized protein n=1 Tax=Fusarium pseudograminearum (strain CS3096) TaxID=1028729 RepID=K3UPA5_FUSPC|nr:hypothetical protein FPSE_05653 [Fusarium pseudograminearum CS3096]EKJ74151.1 hypothetical protein FPSE_05653 [Fusarium pseudograminearum CS3096]KAF0641276.1 hypothetical protein FPSE5266_05653 [Fusarium pseudograminearum]UZP37313.1 hypothetical protein NXS19_005129 [Fusarium pseudograminearum]